MNQRLVSTGVVWLSVVGISMLSSCTQEWQRGYDAGYTTGKSEGIQQGVKDGKREAYREVFESEFPGTKLNLSKFSKFFYSIFAFL